MLNSFFIAYEKKKKKRKKKEKKERERERERRKVKKMFHLKWGFFIKQNHSITYFNIIQSSISSS